MSHTCVLHPVTSLCVLLGIPRSTVVAGQLDIFCRAWLLRQEAQFTSSHKTHQVQERVSFQPPSVGQNKSQDQPRFTGRGNKFYLLMVVMVGNSHRVMGRIDGSHPCVHLLREADIFSSMYHSQVKRRLLNSLSMHKGFFFKFQDQPIQSKVKIQQRNDTGTQIGPLAMDSPGPHLGSFSGTAHNFKIMSWD